MPKPRLPTADCGLLYPLQKFDLHSTTTVNPLYQTQLQRVHSTVSKHFNSTSSIPFCVLLALFQLSSLHKQGRRHQPNAPRTAILLHPHSYLSCFVALKEHSLEAPPSQWLLSPMTAIVCAKPLLSEQSEQDPPCQKALTVCIKCIQFLLLSTILLSALLFLCRSITPVTSSWSRKLSVYTSNDQDIRCF